MNTTDWLMSGDPTLQYLVSKHLLNAAPATYNAYRQSMTKSGWVKQLIDL